MIGKKLTKLLAALDPTEFRRMRKLFQSPIYTSNLHHLKLYDYIRKFYPKFESPRLEKEIVFEKVYGGQAFDDWKLRGLVTEFTRLTEEYFIMLDNQKKEFQRKRQLTKIYGERNLYDFFEKGTKSLLADLEALPYRDMNYYKYKAQLNEAWYFHPMKNKYDWKDTSLEDTMDSIDKYFALTKMYIGIGLKSVERIFKKKYDLRFNDSVKQEFEIGFMKDNVLIRLYRISFQLLEEVPNVDFKFYEALLFENLEILSPNVRIVLFYNGINYALRQSNRGNTIYDKVLMSWYKVGLKNDLLTENNRMNDVIFGNIVAQGCLAKEFDWTHQFIEEYQQYLDIEIRADLVRFNLVKWYFHQQEYEKALTAISEYSFKTKYQPQARMTLIRILFELFLIDESYFDILLNNIKSFEYYILRNKHFTKARLKPHSNSTKLIRKLAIKIFKKEKSQSVENWLLKELNSGKKILSKNWLREKVQQLNC